MVRRRCLHSFVVLISTLSCIAMSTAIAREPGVGPQRVTLRLVDAVAERLPHPADLDPVSPLSIMAESSSSATLRWTAPANTVRVQILRDGVLVDSFRSSGEDSYTDHLLWASTNYSYTARFRSASGSLISEADGTVSTPAQAGDFPRFFSSTSFWNTPIAGDAQVDTNSGAMLRASFLPWQPHAGIDNGDDWGMPIAYASPKSTRYSVRCLMYLCDRKVSFRIPSYAEANLGSGGNWDGHLSVYNADTDQFLDMWQGSFDRRHRIWSASARSKSPASWGAMCGWGQRCQGGGVAAGFNEFGGVIRPEEIAQGHIDHALVICSPYIRYGYISRPAVNIWATETGNYVHDPNAVPLGARIRLSPSFDVAAQDWPRWEKIVAVAFQRYGAYVADVGDNTSIRGEAMLDRGYNAWSLVGMTNTHPSLADLPWDLMQIMQLQPG